MKWIMAGLNSHIYGIMAQLFKRHTKFDETSVTRQGAMALFFNNLAPSHVRKETLEAALAVNALSKLHSVPAL